MNSLLKKRKQVNIKTVTLLLIILLTATGLFGCGQGRYTALPSDTISLDLNELSETKALEDLFTTIDLTDASISDMQTAMTGGHLTSERLTQMYMDRIEAYDSTLDLNSVIAVNPSALDDARELDRERAEGIIRGPLHGIPVIVKANIDVKGMATSAGAVLLSDMVAEEDAFVIKKLKEAGAVILGQANMSEFAYATASSRSTLGGIVHNAYDRTRTPAGSSGGTAVAVTCSFAAAGVGTDTGGSIRNPSSFANIYGMRPSKGLASISGIFPLKAYRDTAGPMTRTAEDMALLMEVMAGTDEEDDYTVEADADTLLGEGYTSSLAEDALQGMRIGYLNYSFGRVSVSGDDFTFYSLDDNVAPMLKEALNNLKEAGAEPVDMSGILSAGKIHELSNGLYVDTFEYDVNKYLSKRGNAAGFRTLGEMAAQGGEGTLHIYLGRVTADYYGFAGSFEDTYDPYTEKIGEYERIPGWGKVLSSRKYMAKIMEDNDIDAVMFLNYFDVAEEEKPMMEDGDYNATGYDIIFGSKLGLPEISLPMGFSAAGGNGEGLPLGLSVFAAFGQEEKLCRIAYAYEQQAGTEIRRAPDGMPALKDEELNAFLDRLTDKAYSISKLRYPDSEKANVQKMLDACKETETLDMEDPYAVYEAARALAEAYDEIRSSYG